MTLRVLPAAFVTTQVKFKLKSSGWTFLTSKSLCRMVPFSRVVLKQRSSSAAAPFLRFSLNYIFKEMALDEWSLQILTPLAPRSCHGWEHLQGTGHRPASRWASGPPRRLPSLCIADAASLLQDRATEAVTPSSRFTAPLTLCRSQMSGVEGGKQLPGCGFNPKRWDSMISGEL